MAVSGRVLQDLMPSMIAATAALTRLGRSLINESFAITIALANFVWIVDRSKMIFRPARFAAGINPAVTTAPSTAPPARAAARAPWLPIWHIFTPPSETLAHL